MNPDLIRQQLSVIETAAAAIRADLDPIGPSPSPGIFVRPGDNLFNLIDQAPANSLFWVDRSVTAEGDFTFTKPVTVTVDGTLPDERITGVGQRLPLIYGTLSAAGVDGVALRGLQVDGTNRAQTLFQYGTRTVLDRVILTGAPVGQKRGIMLDGSRGGTAKWCRVANIWHDQDAQAIYGQDDLQDFWADDCYLESSGENIMIGGGDSGSVARIPRGVKITNCYLPKPLAWRDRLLCTIKNGMELKSCIGWLAEDNVIENVWRQGTQQGYGIVISPRNQNSKAPWSTVENAIFRRTRIINTGAGIQVLGRDNNYPSGIATDVAFYDTTIEGLDYVANPGSGRTIDISGGPIRLTFDGTRVSGRNIHSAFYFAGRQLVNNQWVVLPDVTRGLVVRNHRAPEGEYSVKGDADGYGQEVLDHYAPSAVWENVHLTRKLGRPFLPTPTGTVIDVEQA